MKFSGKKIQILFVVILFGIMDLTAVSQGNEIVQNHFVNSEKVYVQTDREIYIAGDYLFFKIYVVDPVTGHPSQKSKVAYISIRNERNQTIANIHVTLVKGIAYGNLYLTDTIQTGYYQLLSFTNCMRNGSEVEYGSRKLFIANQFDKDLRNITRGGTMRSLSGISDTSKNGFHAFSQCIAKDRNVLAIKVNKETYENRDKVTLSVKINAMDSTVHSNLTVSVFAETPETLNKGAMSDFSAPLVPEKTDSSEFQVTFEKLKKAGIKTEMAYTMTSSVLKNIPKQDTISADCQYLPELQGQIIQGKVFDASGIKEIPNACVFLSVEDTIANLKYTDTDTNGLFRFLVDKYYDGKELHVKVKTADKTENPFILMDNKFVFRQRFIPAFFQDYQALRTFVLKSQDITRIHKVYRTKFTLTDTTVLAWKNDRPKFPHVYDKATHSIRPEDFQALPDFMEISREIIPPLRTRKKGTGYVCNLMNFGLNIYFEGSPAIFLNGILIDDIGQIIHLGSDQISRIECVSTPRFIGNLSFDGILAVFTKKKENDLGMLARDMHFPAGITSPSTLFCMPENTRKPEKFTPDFRQLLYWNPVFEVSGNCEKTIEFSTSDYSGTYIIKVEGITSEGKVVCSQAKFNIESSEK